MTTSDLIDLLKKALEEHGDLKILFTGNYGEETGTAPNITRKDAVYSEQEKYLEINFDLGS